MPDLFEDHVTGDTVCRTCGLCVHDILLDSFGQQAANESHKLLASCGGSIDKGGNLRRALEEVLLGMNVVDSFLSVGYQMVDEIYSSGKSLQGSDLVHVALAITLKICQDFSVYFDVNKVTKTYGPIMKRITKLMGEFFPEAVRSDSNDCPMISRMRVLENLVTKFANEMGLKRVIPSKALISDVSRLSKSGKVKASICLFVMYPDRLREISQHLNRSQTAIRNSVKDMSGLEAEKVEEKKKKIRAQVAASDGKLIPGRNPP